MRRTIRWPGRRGACCAPIRRAALVKRLRSGLRLWFACAFGAFLALVAPLDGRFLARADEGDSLAESGLHADSGFGQMQGFFEGNYDINDLIGASRFHSAGHTGTNAVMANIEAGYAWNGHETMMHVGQIPTSGSALGEIDRHATWVSMIMGGREAGANPGSYQQGLAYDAQFVSGAIATSWPSSASFPRYTASFFAGFSSISTYGPYRAAFITGVVGSRDTTRTADVINTSWLGSSVTTGNDQVAGTFDALAYENPRTLLVTAAGNTAPPGSGAGPNRVRSPASGFNDMTVASLALNGGAYDVVSTFSNGGPNDYLDPVNGLVSAARQVIDIAAPGENISTAYYGGETGGNGPGVFGPPAGLPGGPDYYSRDVDGTSFAAPIVSGGVALLHDAAYEVLAGAPDAHDSRVIKSVLKNSADKIPGWNNGQTAHPNGNGGVLTTKSLDDRIGAGRLNLDKAFDQFLSGTTDVAGTASGLVSLVDTIGWDFGHATLGETNDYLFDQPLAAGSTFTATLDWFRQRATVGTTSFTDLGFDNLELELWKAAGGMATLLVSESKSFYNNFEHFSFAIPTTGEYLLRVRSVDPLFGSGIDSGSEFYGLAWVGVAVPEPGTLALLALAIPAFLLVGRWGNRRSKC